MQFLSSSELKGLYVTRRGKSVSVILKKKKSSCGYSLPMVRNNCQGETWELYCQTGVSMLVTFYGTLRASHDVS